MLEGLSDALGRVDGFHLWCGSASASGGREDWVQTGLEEVVDFSLVRGVGHVGLPVALFFGAVDGASGVDEASCEGAAS